MSVRASSKASGRGTISHSGCWYTTCEREFGRSAPLETRLTLIHAWTRRPRSWASAMVDARGSKVDACPVSASALGSRRLA
jgi:cytosine/adenosine deaminase-related metal-dependent hydrolase